MQINALMMDNNDNVVTCMTEVKAGEQVNYMKDDKVCSLVAEDDIPFCHKIALQDIPKGGQVIKYGESLGEVSEDIGTGHWIAEHNLFSVSRDYDNELVGDDFVMCAKQSEGAPELEGFKFWGYRRAEGRPGIRNHVLILPTCACGSESSRIVASQVRGAVNIVFNTGCSDVAANTEMSQKVLTGFACNPNVYGVVIIGLGCETVPHMKLKEKIQAMTSKPVVSFGIQDEGGTLKTIEKAVRAARDMASEAAMQQKELFPVSEFFLGIECIFLLHDIVKTLVAHDYGIKNSVLIKCEVILLQHGKALALGDGYFARGGFKFAVEYAQECGFACAVGTYDTIAVAVGELEVYVLEQKLSAKGQADV